ncbi:hypothetical protein EYR40_002119 [Pleurotus pulmonarius]|nr:hypothetical protein EYR40_002119 [Pleurotus pulmonarius]
MGRRFTTYYKITTPFKVTGRVTTILRVVPSKVPSATDDHDNTDLDECLQDKFAHLAEIEWQYIKSSRLRFRGDDIDTGKMFRRFGLGPYGRHRAFTAPDGREYVWKMGMWASELYLNDDSMSKRPLIAKYHRPTFNPIGPNKPAYLEILSEGESILDDIVVTFIIVETHRKERERASLPVPSSSPAPAVTMCTALTALSFTTGEDPRNNILQEDGRTVYKIVTPWAMIGRNTTISKIGDDGSTRTVAEIEWHSIASSILKFGGEEVSTSDYFRSTMLSGIINSNRIFTAPNGREYKWRFSQSSKSKLYTNDDSDTLVASFHGSSIGILSSPRDAYLEIFSEGRHIKDAIVMTFVYVEKLRRDRRRAAQ